MDYSIEKIKFAFLLTLMAGLSTGIGSIISLIYKKPKKKFLATSLGFSAGVMIYVSMIEIFPKSKESLSIIYGEKLGYLFTTIAFFSGIFIIAMIDKIIPSTENPHELKEIDSDFEKKELFRMGFFSAIAIIIHNIPEGIATFVAAIENPQIGISIAIAIAIHNIPEGIAVSVPIYYSTLSKKKAFIYSFLSGLSEPIGAIVGYFLLRKFFNENLFGIIFAMVAGIMVYISLDELLPTAEKYGQHHLAIYGLITGMIVMSISLILL